MRGRKRQSASITETKGNPGHRARTKAPAAKPSDLAVPLKVPGGIPRELTKHGKAVWNMVAPQLLKSKLLHPTDRISLTRYCDTVAEYWKVTRELREKDYTYEANKVGGGKMLRSIRCSWCKPDTR